MAERDKNRTVRRLWQTAWDYLERHNPPAARKGLRQSAICRRIDAAKQSITPASAGYAGPLTTSGLVAFYIRVSRERRRTMRALR